MTRFFTAILALFCLLSITSVRADTELNTFAREVDRTESIRAVKSLQNHYAHYAQYGLWNELGALFTEQGTFIFDGLVQPQQAVAGPTAIADFLSQRYGGGIEGLNENSLSSMFIEAPIVNLAVDGESAKARWQVMIFHGHELDSATEGKSEARIEGGVFQNDYVREQGVWKIASVHYYPQYDGPYQTGWTNWGGGDLPVPPRHYNSASAGIPIPPAIGIAPESPASLIELQTRVNTLNDKDRILNLQSAYGYYADRKMWDDVVDLFAEDSAVEIAGHGIWQNKSGVRHWLQSIGQAELAHGQFNDRVQNNVIVTIAPGGNEAFARGIELGMLGEADQEQGWWEVATFRNRFIKEDGVWKIREMRRFPLMKTDIFKGWGENRITDPVPTGLNAPNIAASTQANIAMPTFLTRHPVSGRAIKAAKGLIEVASNHLSPAIAPSVAKPVSIDEARRRLARSAAFDGITNISATYGYYIDDSDSLGWASTLAEKGFKETPFAGYHIGRDRLIAARVRGPGPSTQVGISYHWLMQPVALISDDGRSATGRFRLFQPRTGKTVGEAGDFFGASFWGGMYHNRYVLENGAWRIWEISLDEPYITPVAWKDGVWAKSKDREIPVRRGGGTIDIDIRLSELGKREEHFTGGTGKTWEWPTILPMWFSYTNPVSGREPKLYQLGCAICAIRPDLNLDQNGYQEPPNAPEANRSPE